MAGNQYLSRSSALAISLVLLLFISATMSTVVAAGGEVAPPAVVVAVTPLDRPTDAEPSSNPAKSAGDAHAGPSVRHPEVGVAFAYSAYEDGDAALTRDLLAIASLGAGWVRLDVDWSSLEREPGSINWTALDRLVDLARADGLSVLGLLAYTPSWARPAGSTDKHPPSDPVTLAHFASVAATHFGPRIAAWEVWNEPNSHLFWEPAPDASAYATMLTAAARAVHAAAPVGTIVVSGGMAPAIDADDGSEVAPATFLARVIAAGAGQDVDAIGMHPYSYPALPSATDTATWNSFVRLPLLYDLLVRAGLGDRPLWLTEVGAPTGTASQAVSEERQAEIVVDAVRAAGTLGWVTRTFVFTHRDSRRPGNDLEAHFGLLNHDGSPKLAWTALESLLRG